MGGMFRRRGLSCNSQLNAFSTVLELTLLICTPQLVILARNDFTANLFWNRSWWSFFLSGKLSTVFSFTDTALTASSFLDMF